jgi:putative membrane protein
MVRFILRVIISALGFWVASMLVPGVHIVGPHLVLGGGPHAPVLPYALLWGALVLGIVNALVRPIITLLTLPFTIITLGLFLLVVNGISISLVAYFVHDIRIDTFWHAMLTAIVVALTGWVGSWFLGSAEQERRR